MGQACSVSRGVLEKLADQLSSTGSKKFAEVNGPQAFLCHLCDGKLQSIPRHEEQLRALRAEISTQLQSVLHDSDTDEEIPQSARVWLRETTSFAPHANRGLID